MCKHICILLLITVYQGSIENAIICEVITYQTNAFFFSGALYLGKEKVFHKEMLKVAEAAYL